MHKKTRPRLGHAYIYVYMNPPGPQQLYFSLDLGPQQLDSHSSSISQRSTASSTNIWSQFCHSKGGSKWWSRLGFGRIIIAAGGHRPPTTENGRKDSGPKVIGLSCTVNQNMPRLGPGCRGAHWRRPRQNEDKPSTLKDQKRQNARPKNKD